MTREKLMKEEYLRLKTEVEELSLRFICNISKD
jgi:hypothetical protein